MTRPITRKFHFTIGLLSLVVAIITLRDTGVTIDPGLDAPFRWAFSYFMAYDRAALANVQYTIGPLSILKGPAPIGDQIIISSCFFLLISCLFTWLFTLFYCAYRNTRQRIVPIASCIVCLLVINVDTAIAGCIVMAMLFYRFLNNKKIIAIAILLTVAGVYIKTSLFIQYLSIWVPFVGYLLTQKRYIYILRLLLSGLLLFLVAGLLLLGSFKGFVDFTYHNIGFALKYNDLLSLYPDNNWYALGICLGSILTLYILFIRQAGGFVLGLFSLYLFTCWKYAIGREDFVHALTFVYPLIVVMLLFLTVQRERVQMATPLFLTAICFYNFNLHNPFGYNNSYYWLPDVANFNERIVRQKKFKEDMLAQSKRSCAPNVLPDEWRKTIGSQTADAFPWDLSIIWVNGFRYKARPCLQVLRYNDKDDAAFLRSDSAAHYFIWHATPGNQTNIDGMDDQYLLNNCPEMFGAMLTDYRPTGMVNDKFAVWEKRDSAGTIKQQDIDSLSLQWGQWLNVPAHDSSTIIKGHITYSNTPLYALRCFVYKGLPTFMEYETDSGRVLRYSFAKQSGKDGVFLNPLWTDDRLSFVNIKRVRFLNDDQYYFSDRLQVVLERLTVIPGK